MISSAQIYILIIASIATLFAFLNIKHNRLFKYVPAVVIVYAFCMFLASIGIFEKNSNIEAVYDNSMRNLLPAMLFLILLQVNIRDFFKLGKKLLSAYLLALFSIAFSFVVVSYLFHFDKEMSAAFGALSGSWMGGIANMVAVAEALGVSKTAFGYALIVDSVNYTLWIMFLLFLTPFASYFNNFTASAQMASALGDIGCSCTIGAKRYGFLVILSILVALGVNLTAQSGFMILNYTTTTVILATIMGILASFTSLRTINGSSEIATTMLYLLIALIGSKAYFEDFSGVGVYVFAGFCILALHALLMVIGAKIFKLDLFSIAVASLANIGGVASASILAASYNKALAGVGALMAIMGYIVGTFGGLMIGEILIGIAK